MDEKAQYLDSDERSLAWKGMDCLQGNEKSERTDTHNYTIPQHIEWLWLMSHRARTSLNAPSNMSRKRELLRRDLKAIFRSCAPFCRRNGAQELEIIEFPSEVEKRLKKILLICESILQSILNINLDYSTLRKEERKSGLHGLFKRRKVENETLERQERDFTKFSKELLMINISMRLALVVCSGKLLGTDEEAICVNICSRYLHELIDILQDHHRYRSTSELENQNESATEETTAEACIYLFQSLSPSVPSTGRSDLDNKLEQIFNARGGETVSIFLSKMELLESVFGELEYSLLLQPGSRATSPPPSYETAASNYDSTITLVAATPMTRKRDKDRDSIMSKGFGFVKGFLHPSAQPAMDRCDFDAAFDLVRSGADPNVSNRYGHTLLHVYAKAGDNEKVSWLLSNTKICVNGKDSVGKTPLHHTCQQSSSNSSLEVLKTLLNYEADVWASDNNGWKPLHLLCWKSNVGPKKTDFINLLLNHGASVLATDIQLRNSIHTACVEDDVHALRALLNSTTEVDVGKSDLQGRTALHYAAESRNKELVDLLFLRGSGADVNATDSRGQTPLHYAFIHHTSSPGIRSIVEDLIARGADVDAQDREGNAPLHYAISNAAGCNPEFIKWFINKYAPDVNTPKDALVLTIWTRTNGCKDVLKILLDAGAMVTARAYRAALEEWVIDYDEEVTDVLRHGLSRS